MMKKKIFALLFISVILISSVSAFFPVTHKYLNKQLTSSAGSDSNLYQTCINNKDLCYVGNVLSDISVVYYFTEGFKYEITHSPGFCINMLEEAIGDEERACAIGSCLHATQDVVSHNSLVPNAIRKTSMPNDIIHTFAEQKLDNIVEGKDPLVKSEVVTLGEESWNKCIPLLTRVLENKYVEYDDDITSGKLEIIINTFVGEVQNSITGYDVSFKNKASIFGKLSILPIRTLLLYLSFMFLFSTLTVLLIFKRKKGIVNWISLLFFGVLAGILVAIFVASFFGNAFVTFQFFIKPVSNLVPIGNADAHLQQSITNGNDFFNQGEEWARDKDASAFRALNQADDSIQITFYIIMITLILLMAFLIYINFRKREKGIFKL